MWDCLRRAGIADRIQDCGRLFELDAMPAGADSGSSSNTTSGLTASARASVSCGVSRSMNP